MDLQAVAANDRIRELKSKIETLKQEIAHVETRTKQFSSNVNDQLELMRRETNEELQSLERNMWRKHEVEVEMQLSGMDIAQRSHLDFMESNYQKLMDGTSQQLENEYAASIQREIERREAALRQTFDSALTQQLDHEGDICAQKLTLAIASFKQEITMLESQL